jgi:ketosteroid isomerase-like protein
MPDRDRTGGPASPRSPNAELAVRAVTLQGNRDFDALRAMSAEDVVLDFPFHPGGPETHHGVDALIAQFSVLNVFASFEMEVVDVFDPGDNTVIIEGKSRGTYRSGRADYTNHYLFVLCFAQGKLIRWREFFNPLEAMKQNYGMPGRTPA